MPYAEHDGCRLFYEEHGAGEPILFVAGLGGVSTYWKPQVEAFARDFRVIVYDQRGSGRSDHVEVRSVEQMAADTLAVLDAAGLDSVHYVGHSTGGAIGQALAIDAPDRLRSLVINSSTTRSDAYRRKVFAVRQALLERAGPELYAMQTSLLLYPSWWINRNAGQLAADEARTAAGLAPPPVQISRMNAILSFDRLADYRHIRVPTLVLCARDDILTPPYFSEELAREIPGARLVLLETGGHACSVTVAETFNEIVRAFVLESARPPA